MKFSNLRNKHGAMMGIIIACTIVFIFVVIAIVQISMLFSGSRELSNAVDSGTLNTGLKATTVTVDIQSGSTEDQFSDVAENGGKSFSLKSIDRMWAKCLLCMMNEKGMETDGYSGGSSSSDADQLFQAATSISDRLAAKLNDQNSLKQFFTDLVAKESLRALGNSASVVYEPGTGWATSLLDRGIESNVAVYPEQLPTGFDMSSINSITASDGKSYFKGYTPINVLNHSVTFVPFRLNNQPHLVSMTTFNQNTNSTSPIGAWPNPVPNAFSCQGKSSAQHLDTQHARSFVLSNPQKTYDLSIPHSFLHINLGTNTCHFWCNAAPYPIYDQTYGYFPATPYVAQSGPMDGGAGVCTATQTPLGSEFLPPTIWQALTPTGNYGGSYDKLKTVLTQRCDEMKHGFQESDLESLLSSMLMPGITDYYIYPDDSGNVVVSPSISNPIPPSWVLSGGSADGQQQEICSNGDSTFGVGPVVPPFVVTTVEYEGIGGGSGVVMECDSVKWTAGTGYNGNLGDITCTHELEAYCIAAGFL